MGFLHPVQQVIIIFFQSKISSCLRSTFLKPPKVTPYGKDGGCNSIFGGFFSHLACYGKDRGCNSIFGGFFSHLVKHKRYFSDNGERRVATAQAYVPPQGGAAQLSEHHNMRSSLTSSPEIWLRRRSFAQPDYLFFLYMRYWYS